MRAGSGEDTGPVHPHACADRRAPGGIALTPLCEQHRGCIVGHQRPSWGSAPGSSWKQWVSPLTWWRPQPKGPPSPALPNRGNTALHQPAPKSQPGARSPAPTGLNSQRPLPSHRSPGERYSSVFIYSYSTQQNKSAANGLRWELATI